MRKACVTCHNAHPDSPKRDWKVGDVRGIQEVSVKGLEVKGFEKFSYLLGYVGLLGMVSVGAAASFQRQAADLERSNRRLKESNERETAMSDRLRSQVSELSLLGEVVENATFGVTIADMRRDDTPLIYVNEAFSEITGYPKESATGYNCRFLRGPETDPGIIAEIRRALREGNPYNCVLLNYRMDGSTFWNRLTLYPVGGIPGRPDFYVGNQVDVTSLLESEARSHSALAGMRDPLHEAMQATREAMAFSRQLFSKLSARELLTEDLKKFFEAEFAALNKLEAHLGDTTNLLDGFDGNSEAILSSGSSAADS
jgi:PAS domain S-box-containing protein